MFEKLCKCCVFCDKYERYRKIKRKDEKRRIFDIKKTKELNWNEER